MNPDDATRADHPAGGPLFWRLIDHLQDEYADLTEGTIMGGPCVRVAGEFLGLVDYKGSGLVVKLPRARVEQLVATGIGRPFAPAGKVFREWISVPVPDKDEWEGLLREGIKFVTKS